MAFVNKLPRLESIVDAVGSTPLLRLHCLQRDAPGVAIYLKLEYTNPGGSVKDRPAKAMLLDAIARNKLGPGTTLLDATSRQHRHRLFAYGRRDGKKKLHS